MTTPASIVPSRPYTPTVVELPRDADYILPGGAIAIAGNDGMAPLITAFCALFSQTRPEFRFDLTMHGSSMALGALTAGASVLAPMSRAPWASDIAAFRTSRGYLPTSIRIGYTGHGPRPHAKTPPALYVHKDNPLGGLCMEDVARIFTSGAPAGDLNLWDQLGLAGPWAGRRIHLYGLRDDGKYASGFRDAHLGRRAYAGHYEPLASREAVIRAVAQDPFGIGAIGWLDVAKVSSDVRIVPLSRERDGSFHTPQLADVSAGAYPLSAFLRLYFDHAPDTPLSPFVREFLTLALSTEGQAMVASYTGTREGYVRLSAADWQVEIETLDAL